MRIRGRFRCPFCHGEISTKDFSCPHCKAGQDGLTEGQVIALSDGAKRYIHIAAIILIIGGASFTIGIAGIFVHMIMVIVGFVPWAISLVIAFLLLSRARYLKVISAVWGKRDAQAEAMDNS